MSNSLLSTVKASSTAKPCWAIAAFVSIVFAFQFTVKSEEQFKEELLLGFCVWCSPEMPSRELGCIDCVRNSHLDCAVLQVLGVLAALFFCFKDKEANANDRRVYHGIMLVLSLHGILHWFIQARALPSAIEIDCSTDDFSRLLVFCGYAFYLPAAYTICYVVFTLAFGAKDNEQVGEKDQGEFPIKRASLFCAALVFFTTLIKGFETVFPSLFVVTHLLVCNVGLISRVKTFENDVLAILFSIASLCGILELNICQQFLQKWWGHLWYDIFLLAAQMSALPYFNKEGQLCFYGGYDSI